MPVRQLTRPHIPPDPDGTFDSHYYPRPAVDAALAAKADASALAAHVSDAINPHGVTKDQVGLGNVDDTADAAKPISTATGAALDAKADRAEIYDRPTSDGRYAPAVHTHTQAQSHNAADTDSAPTALHHTLGTGPAQAAAGDHSHTAAVALEFVLFNGGGVLTTGPKPECDLAVPFAGTITGWTLLLDAGTITMDVWKSSYASYPPTAADTIAGTAKPVVTAGAKNQSTTLTGWTTSIAAGDILRLSVAAVATATKATLVLDVTRTVR